MNDSYVLPKPAVYGAMAALLVASVGGAFLIVSTGTSYVSHGVLDAGQYLGWICSIVSFLVLLFLVYSVIKARSTNSASIMNSQKPFMEYAPLNNTVMGSNSNFSF